MAYLTSPNVVRDRPSNANTVGTVASVSGLKLLGEYGFGPLRCATLGLTNVSVTANRNSTTSAWGTQSLYTFPTGGTLVLGAFGRLTATRGEATNMQPGAAFLYSIGSAAVVAGDAATVVDTKADIIPATTATMSGGTIAFNLLSRSAITVLTDNSGGTASDTLADVPGAYTEATLANQIASLAAKVNALIRNTSAAKVAAFDGTSSAAAAILNFSNSNGSSAQIATGDSSILFTGSVSLFYVNLGLSTANDSQP